MVLAGLPLSTLLAIGAAVGAVTVGLYVLRLRRRPVQVAFAQLWVNLTQEKQSTSLFARLKRLISLLVQLAIVAALVLALGDPRPDGHREEGRTLVVLLDSSASMMATDGEPTRFEAARSKVSELIEGLASDDRMLLVRVGPMPVPLAALTSDQAALTEALARAEPAETGADVEAAFRLAFDALEGQSSPEVVLVTDGLSDEERERVSALDRKEAKISHLAVGEESDNVAITQFAVRRYPLDKSRHEVLIELTNVTDRSVALDLTLQGDGEPIDVKRIELGPREQLRRSYPDLGGASGTLEAEIARADGTRDTLPADDRAFALMPERTRSRVLVVTRGNTYLEAALLLDTYLDVTRISPEQYPPEGAFDVTIFDAVAPEREARTGAALYLAPPSDGPDASRLPVALGKPIEMFGFDQWDEASPLLDHMLMPDIQVLSGHTLKPEPEDHIVGASELGPILVEGSREAGRFVQLGFDPRMSDFVLRVGWPLFVLNVIDTVSHDDAKLLSNYRTGEVWHVPLPPELEDAKSIEVKDPRGRELRVPVEAGRAVLSGERAGIYENADRSFRVAANLVNLTESSITPVPSLELFGAVSTPVEGLRAGSRREPWVLLLLAVLAVSLVEWITYHRRWTV